MKKSMLKSFLFAMIGLFTFSQVQAEERVVATVNGTPILQSQVNAVMGKKGSQRAALDKIIDDMLTEKAIKESGVSRSKPYRRRYCSEKWFNLWSILRCVGLSRYFLKCI